MGVTDMNNKSIMDHLMTKQEFIDRSNKLFDCKYDYSKIKYYHPECDVEIICPKHGTFIKRPSKHIKGYGCPKCHR